MVPSTCGDISGLARMAFVNRGQLRDCIQMFVPEGELTALARHELGPPRDRSFLRIKPSLTLNFPIFNSKSPAFQLGRVLPSALTSYLSKTHTTRAFQPQRRDPKRQTVYRGLSSRRFLRRVQTPRLRVLLASTQTPHSVAAMAPSLLLQPEEDQPYISPTVKQMSKSEGGQGGVSLEVHAPTAHNLSVNSSSHVSGAGNTGDTNGLSGMNGHSSRQLDGEHFITSETLLANARNFASNNAGHEAPKKPNILYIMADQMAAPLLKMNNPDSVIKTPNLDELAKTGVVFSSAYCNSPLCAPSRFTMCTGQLPSKIAGYDNASVLSSEVPTYAHYLRREGYETALAGKMHFIGKDQLHGFEHRYVIATATASGNARLRDLDLLLISILATLVGR
jgi:hypothetical protein